MVRDLRRLADTRFDVLVIGAGVYGAATAWDAASRGLNVALIDRSDFGSGTSFHNLKTLHGGLRSLQAMNLRQMRRFIRERRALVRIAPHLVRPLPFIIPTSAPASRHRAGDASRPGASTIWSRAIATRASPIPTCTCRAAASSRGPRRFA